jgi:hypothetical protein
LADLGVDRGIILKWISYTHDGNSGAPNNGLWGGGGSTNSAENRGQIERGSEGGSILVRGSAQFANG